MYQALQRFQKLGFTGFHDLKLSISKNINNNEDTVDIPVIPDSEGFIEKIFESTLLNSILALQEALNVIDCSIIKSVAGFLSIKTLKQKFLLLAVVAQRPSAMTLTISY